MVATPEGPAGSATREHHHRMVSALHELHSELSARVLAAAEIEKTLEEGSDDDEDDL